MFEVHLTKGEHLNGAALSATTATLANALDFIGEFYEGPLFLSWVGRNESYLVEVYDWIDCWFDDPPVRARVIAPCGFRPPDCQVWFRNRSGQDGPPALDA